MKQVYDSVKNAKMFISLNADLKVPWIHVSRADDSIGVNWQTWLYNLKAKLFEVYSKTTSLLDLNITVFISMINYLFETFKATLSKDMQINIKSTLIIVER